MWRFLAAALMVAAVVGPAHAQGKKGSPNTQLPLMEEEQKKQSKEVDRAYSDTMKRTQQKNAKPYDPWGSVRSPTAPAAKN